MDKVVESKASIGLSNGMTCTLSHAFIVMLDEDEEEGTTIDLFAA